MKLDGDIRTQWNSRNMFSLGMALTKCCPKGGWSMGEIHGECEPRMGGEIGQLASSCRISTAKFVRKLLSVASVPFSTATGVNTQKNPSQ
jgi:hypothetical protein